MFAFFVVVIVVVVGIGLELCIHDVHKERSHPIIANVVLVGEKN